MRKAVRWLLVIAVICVGLAGCSSKRRVLPPLNAAAFESLSITVSPRQGFRVSVLDPAIDAAAMAAVLDDDWDFFVACMAQEYQLTVVPLLAQSFRYVIIPQQWSCYGKTCMGEYNLPSSLDGPAYIALWVQGPLLAALHEWRDVYDHSHEDQPGPCTRGA